MSDTELAWLECGQRVGMETFLTDKRSFRSMLGYASWRWGPLAAAMMMLGGFR